MKKQLLILFAASCSVISQAQVTWQSYPGAPTNGFWDMDTLNGKLYVSTGFVQEFDGSTWTTLSNYNNSLNTPNKTKSCVKAIGNDLYAGAKDFNTGGEGDIHYLNGGNWNLKQNSNFTYNGSYKIRAFEQYNSEVYTAGLFEVPGSAGTRNVAKWDGTDWVSVGRDFGSYPPTTEVIDLQTYAGKLYLTEGSNVWAYNGTSWDSILYPANGSSNFPMSGGTIKDLAVYNGELYISGFFHLSATSTNLLLVKYNGTSFSAVTKSEGLSQVLSAGTYTAVGNMGVVDNKLFFFAKKTSDNNVYLVNYDGANISEISKVADYGDFSFSPGYEINTFKRIIQFGSDLVIGGTFTKVNGQTMSALAALPGMVGINEHHSELALTVFPNPSTGELSIRTKENETAHLAIYDQLGQLIRKWDHVRPGEKVQHNPPKGMYFCVVSTPSGTQTLRLEVY